MGPLGGDLWVDEGLRVPELSASLERCVPMWMAAAGRCRDEGFLAGFLVVWWAGRWHEFVRALCVLVLAAFHIPLPKTLPSSSLSYKSQGKNLLDLFFFYFFG